MPRQWLHALALACFLAGIPAAAQGFWPLERGTRVIPDSLSKSRWHERFQGWKDRPAGAADAATTPLPEDEALRKATESGLLDPSLVARLAAEARAARAQMAGAAPGSVTPTPGGAPVGASTAASDTSMAPGSQKAAPATGFPPPDSLLGFQGAAADSLTPAGAGSPLPAAGGLDSTAAAQQPTTPFGNVPPGGAPAPAFVDRGFAPSLNSSLQSSNDRMRLTSSLATAFNDRSGATLSGSLGHDQELRLSQGSENESNSIVAALTLPVQRAGLTLAVSASNIRRNSLGARTTAGRTSDAAENRLASLQVKGARSIVRGLAGNAYYSRNLSVDEQTIAATSTAGQGQRSTETTGNAFGVGLNIDRLQWLRLRGRFGRAQDSRLFTSPSFVTADNPLGETTQPSEGDSVSVRAEMPIGRIVPQLVAEFQVRRSEYSYTDVTRTASGGISDATSFAVETERRFSRSVRLNGSIEPWTFLSANFNVELARDSEGAALRSSLFEDTKRTRWNVGSTLRHPWGGQLRVNLESTRSDVNRDEASNPTNPQTRLDESREMSGEILQNFTRTLKVRAYGNVSLAQSFYVHTGPTGLGDRDDTRAQLGLDLDGTISSKATARVQMYVRSFDQTFIDRRRSKDSRDETEYVIRQSFDYKITPNVQVRQFYGLSSKVVDETFDPNGDTLNRNHFLQTTMHYVMTSRLTLDARMDYRLQDNGFYLQRSPRLPERIFAPSARTKTDEIGLGMRYALVKDGKLTFVSNQVATREYRTTFFSGRPTGTSVTQRGNLGLGLESRIQLGDLALDAKVTRNQSFNVSLNRTVYYDAQSTLSYTF